MKNISKIALIFILFISLTSFYKTKQISDSIMLYPNPADTYFKISSTSTVKPKNIVVFNIVGGKVLEQKLNNLPYEQVNISNLAAGKYFVKIDLSNKTQLTKLLSVK